jgi:hypothetical protein
MTESQMVTFGMFIALILMGLIMLAVVSALNKLGIAIEELRKSFDDFRTKVLSDYVPREEFRQTLHTLRNDMQAWKNSR